MVLLYWKALFDKSTSTGNNAGPARASRWRSCISLRALTILTNCPPSCWTCLLSRSSILTKTSARNLANRTRASCRQRRINLQKSLTFEAEPKRMVGTGIHNFQSPPCRSALEEQHNRILHRPFPSLWGNKPDTQTWHPHTSSPWVWCLEWPYEDTCPYPPTPEEHPISCSSSRSSPTHRFNFLDHFQPGFFHVPMLLAKESERLTSSGLRLSNGQRSKNIPHRFDRLKQLQVGLRHALFGWK